MSVSDPIAPEFLVIGGGGKTGRRVADRLTALGHSMRAVSRSTDPAFDWEQPQGWAAALDGVKAAYATYHPDLALPGAAGRVEALAGMAADRGLERFVLLSGRGEPGAQDAEQRVLAALPHASVVRASWFFQNFSENFMIDGVLAGEIALPVGDVREPFIDADDIADVAVAHLTTGNHAGQISEVTGPEALTFAEACTVIGEATGRPVRFRQIGLAEFQQDHAESGVPQELLYLMQMLFAEVLDGRNADTANGVQTVLGRAPRTFREFAKTTAATGVWTPQ